MRTAVEMTGEYLAEFDKLRPHLPGKDLPWLHALRQTGLEDFSRLGFPDPRLEAWKYTNVKPIIKHNFQQSFKACVGLDLDDLGAALLPGLDCHRLVFVNGKFTRTLSRLESLPNGVSLLPFADALAQHSDLLQQHLGQHIPASNSGFTALNQSLFSDGAVIHIAEGITLDKPIHLVFVAAMMRDPTWHHLRNLIVLAAGSRATVLETYLPIGDSVYLHNLVSECVLQENAELTHYKVQQESMQGFHIASLHAEQARGSHFISHSFSFGARLARNDINVALRAPESSCELNGLYLANGRQHCDYHTRIDHYQPHGSSNEVYKGIIGGRGRAVFNGQVYVHPDAQKTDAQQHNQNLLLSEHAEIDTKPQLEIYADDVKCSHGATVGQLDEDMMFYLRSRGIPEHIARGLLTYGFAADLLARCDLQAVCEHISHLLLEHLPNSECISDIT